MSPAWMLLGPAVGFTAACASMRWERSADYALPIWVGSLIMSFLLTYVLVLTGVLV